MRPPDDDELAADLDRLRAALTQLDAKVREGTRHGNVASALAPESARLQDRIRRRSRLGRRAATAAPRRGAVEDVIAAGLAAWVSYIEVDGRLAALRVVDGVVTIVELGRRAPTAQREATLLRSVLTMHLNAVGRGVERDPAPCHGVGRRGRRRCYCARSTSRDGPVVLSPIAGLHDLPWGLLPSLRTRSFVLAPSVGPVAAVRARSRRAGPRASSPWPVPDVPFADVEAEQVAARYGAGDGPRPAPAATRGRRRARRCPVPTSPTSPATGGSPSENPMFSSLLLGDGPMFVYDLERIAPAPGVVVLSACHAGAHATPAGREILGLTASLLAMGPRAVVAATVPIPDTLVDGRRDGPVARRLAGRRCGPADALVDAAPRRPRRRRRLRLPRRRLSVRADRAPGDLSQLVRESWPLPRRRSSASTG